MSAKLFFAAIVVVLSMTTGASGKDPLSQCNLLSNKKLAPFIYLSQSELAVLAYYSTVDYDAFKNGRVTNFHITPVCFVKGFHSGLGIEVWSGFQKCPITQLSNLVEYPSLFFLRRDHTNDRWLLINSGEYQHRVDTTGLLFGVDRTIQNFPEACGLKRRRIIMDKDKCDSMACKGYCSFRLASPKDCVDKRDLMRPYLNAADIPTDVAPFDANTQSAFRNKKVPKGRSGGGTIPGENEKTTKGKGEGISGPSITYAPEAGKASEEVEVTGGKNSAVAAVPATALFLLVSLFALCHSR